MLHHLLTLNWGGICSLLAIVIVVPAVILRAVWKFEKQEANSEARLWAANRVIKG